MRESRSGRAPFPPFFAVSHGGVGGVMRCFFVYLVGVGGCDSSEGGLALFLFCLTKRVCVCHGNQIAPSEEKPSSRQRQKRGVCEQSMAVSAEFVVFSPSAFFPHAVGGHDGNADSLQQPKNAAHACNLLGTEQKTVLKNTLKKRIKTHT